MLQRWIRHLLISLLALTALAAQAGGLFLWEAENAGQRVWLLGSIHLGKPDFYPLPEPIESAYRQAESIAVEADVSDSAAISALVPQAMLPEAKSLSGLLTKKQNQQLDTALERLALPRAFAERMKPWFLALSLSALDMQAQGYQPQYGIDMHFLQRAKEDGKPIVELESAQFQFAMLNRLSDAESLAVLDATLGPVVRGELKALLEGMVDAWQSGDSESLQAVIEASSAETPEMRHVNEQLFAKRNRAMSEKIAGLANVKAPLVIVGAGHLVGPDSILNLLQARGFRVKQY
ncbi:TraB/GumN family protein [Chitinimonas sp. BJB300]|uniref:TraB/GumN family protein n=1 Tax=Chitinimonas sp. BJB300 TaxID=1559339 RepID=UPI000C0F51E7|nr:TraB/GumN family protein [Chitinimonas sp. BJB300]PHV10869.1 hypothetical protein CSQ89_13885 [Chitinimonas sp. BJB300]TSJ91318.1 TraB/GumN family protein [Chitinimonas sp. BJB300]